MNDQTSTENRTDPRVELERLVSLYGFDKCEWPPEESSECEGCRQPGKQLYFSGPTDAGVYFCLDCIGKMHEENMEFLAESERLEKGGHTYHCAARQVWGDGECECGKQGVIPGQISRMMCEG